MSEAFALAIMVVAVAACVGVTRWSDDHKPQPDPTTACVKAAWTQHDRVECLKAGKINGE